MQTVSEIYQRLLTDRNAVKETKVVIAGEEYLQDRLISANTRGSLFSGNSLEIGGTVAREINLVLRNAGIIPRAAKLEPYTRLTNGTITSEWLRKGVYYIATRREDTESGTLTVHGYDAMLKTEKDFTTNGDQGQWPMTDSAVVDEICRRIGVKLDARTVLNRGFLVQYPGYGDGAYTMREVLGYIGSMYAGNWIMSDAGELLLIRINDLEATTSLLIEEHGFYISMGGVRLIV